MVSVQTKSEATGIDMRREAEDTWKGEQQVLVTRLEKYGAERITGILRFFSFNNLVILLTECVCAEAAG